MAPNDRRETLARRAYEAGRARTAIRGAAIVVPMVIASLSCCNRPWVSLALGGGLFLATALALFRGGLHARAVGPGLLAGAVPLLLPLVLRGSGLWCGEGACSSVCVNACVAAGLVAGALVGWSSRRESRPLPFLVVGGLLAALTGALGCVFAGAGGVVAMLGGLVVASAPRMMSRQAS